MPRRVYLLGVGLVLVGGALALTHELLGPTPGVTEANVRRIKEGMSRQEVEAILGGPGQSLFISREFNFWRESRLWFGDDGVALVLTSSTNGNPEVVQSTSFHPKDGRSPPDGRTPLQRLRALLGW